MKEKTAVGKILQKIGKAVPGVLQIASDLTGIDALESAAQLISGDTSISKLDKDTLLKQIDVAKEMEIHRLQDIASARDMQKTALVQSDLFSKRFVYYLASFWSVVSALFIFFVFFVDIPDNSVRLIDTILGFLLGTIVASIIGFFFGSSSGSDKKTDLINELKKGLS